MTKAAIRYKVNRQYVYRWRKHYDGTLASLADKSHKPHHHPNQHTADERWKLITFDMRRRKSPMLDLLCFGLSFVERGYTRSITGLYRILRKQGQMPVKPPNPKYVPKPYEQMLLYPGQRVQIRTLSLFLKLALSVKLMVKSSISIQLLTNIHVSGI